LVDALKSWGFPIAAVVLAVVIVLHVVGGLSVPTFAGSTAPSLPPADTPPLEYVYLDSLRVAAYLGQVEDGLATSEQRTEQLTRSVNASISAGTVAQIA
jgi:hypothetical protein